MNLGNKRVADGSKGAGYSEGSCPSASPAD